MVFNKDWVAEWPPFGEKAAYSVNRMFSLHYVYLYLVISHFGFEGKTVVLSYF